MKIYTKTGDTGKTSLIGGRVDKDSLRIEAYGTMDELNSFIGKAMTELDNAKFADLLVDLEAIQNELFDGGGDLANVMKERHYKLSDEPIEVLEKRIDDLMEEAPPLEKFILPGGSAAAATLHIARTVDAPRGTVDGDVNESGRRCASYCPKIFEPSIGLSFRRCTYRQCAVRCSR